MTHNRPPSLKICISQQSQRGQEYQPSGYWRSSTVAKQPRPDVNEHQQRLGGQPAGIERGGHPAVCCMPRGHVRLHWWGVSAVPGEDSRVQGEHRRAPGGLVRRCTGTVRHLRQNMTAVVVLLFVPFTVERALLLVYMLHFLLLSAL